MTFDPHWFVSELRGARRWDEAMKDVAETVWATPHVALELEEALDAELARGDDPALRSVRGALIPLLGRSPDPAASDVAISIARRAGGDRRFLSLSVVGTRPADELWGALARGAWHGDPELGLLLVHDLIVRGSPSQPVADELASWAVEVGHDLAVLPVRLLPVEGLLPGALPFWQRYRGSAQPLRSPAGPPGRLADALAGLGTRIPLDVERFGAPFRRHAGDQEVAAFARGVGFRAQGEFPEPQGGEVCRAVDPDRLCRLFFHAAAAGPRSQGGPWSRLHMWTAISAVVDLPWPSPIDQLDDALRAATVLELEPDDPWFEDALSSAWYVVQMPARIVVLAAISHPPS